jgi:hypothetical protein
LGLNYHIIYRRGKENMVADALSKRNNYIDDKQELKAKKLAS